MLIFATDRFNPNYTICFKVNNSTTIRKVVKTYCDRNYLSVNNVVNCYKNDTNTILQFDKKISDYEFMDNDTVIIEISLENF